MIDGTHRDQDLVLLGIDILKYFSRSMTYSNHHGMVLIVVVVVAVVDHRFDIHRSADMIAVDWVT